MNQKKIGDFIAELRKSKKMTQQELADELKVTDRAISNWENGRRMPDVSFYKPLCEIFDISVNELLNGEKMTKDENISSFSDTLIDTLKVSEENKKKSSRIIRILCFVLLVFLLLLFLILRYYQGIYPKIDIYYLNVASSDPDVEYTLEKQWIYQFDNQEYDVYYYGIDAIQLCDLKENCYELKTALNHQQTSIESIKNYLESQFVLNNVDSYMLLDGGTTIYSNSSYSVMFCNTIEGNHDVYIGVSNMVEKLNGNYCGRLEYTTKSFVRTYYIVSVTDDDDEDFFNVTLREFQGETALVKINKTTNIIVGRNYEFTFLTFSEFEDTIENIFEYCTILKVVETDKMGLDQIQEEIYVNEDLDTKEELNEVENVVMTIEEGSLSKTEATIVITDWSGEDYDYGSWFRIDKKIGNSWVGVKETGENYSFNAMAYKIDIDHQLRMEQYWEAMYGPLSSGTYRLVKEVDGKYFSVEFEID